MKMLTHYNESKNALPELVDKAVGSPIGKQFCALAEANGNSERV